MGVSGCDFTLTYTWSGFRGQAPTPELRLIERTGGQFDIGFAYFDGPAGKSGTVIHTFHLTAGSSSSRNIYARGSLLKGSNTGTEISGSVANSSNTVTSTCGTPIS